MNKLNYILKYAEYLIRKTRVFVTPDLYFHTAALNKISGSQADLINPVTLSEKICHRLVFDRNPFYTLLADKLAVRDYVHAKTRRAQTCLYLYKLPYFHCHGCILKQSVRVTY